MEEQTISQVIPATSPSVSRRRWYPSLTPAHNPLFIHKLLIITISNAMMASEDDTMKMAEQTPAAMAGSQPGGTE